MSKNHNDRFNLKSSNSKIDIYISISSSKSDRFPNKSLKQIIQKQYTEGYLKGNFLEVSPL